jgi:hypothetical protein
MLGQQERWTARQKLLLEQLAKDALESDLANEDERREVAAAIKSGTHKVTLRQGVLGLLKSLDLSHLKKNWDALYGERSALVHGLAPKPGADYSSLAFKAVSLCGHILLAAVAKEIPLANIHVHTFYKV